MQSKTEPNALKKPPGGFENEEGLENNTIDY